MLGGCFHVWMGRRRGLGTHVNNRPTTAEERKKRKSGVFHCCREFARCYNSSKKSRVCDALRFQAGIAHHPISQPPCLLPPSLTPPPWHGRLACISVR
jgi:hypothetical protein